MRRLLLIVPLLLALAAAWALASSQDDAIARWAAGWQREFQNALAGGLRALRAGHPGAVAALLSTCFAYGFFHAVGPGHGKLLIGGYGLGSKVSVLRLSAISLLSSLGQAVTAIALVLLGLFLLDWSRERLTGIAETIMLPMSTVAIGLVGFWLATRGLRRLWAGQRALTARHAGADHHHMPGQCGSGHRHGPTPEELEETTGLRDALVLVASIAMRPCSGAILLLVLAWHMEILPSGILGVLAMSSGTAALTILVALLSVFARESTRLSLGPGRAAGMVLPLIEVSAGVAILGVSVGMLGLT